VPASAVGMVGQRRFVVVGVEPPRQPPIRHAGAMGVGQDQPQEGVAGGRPPLGVVALSLPLPEIHRGVEFSRTIDRGQVRVPRHGHHMVGQCVVALVARLSQSLAGVETSKTGCPRMELCKITGRDLGGYSGPHPQWEIAREGRFRISSLPIRKPHVWWP
jgi:hypothetical protein